MSGFFSIYKREVKTFFQSSSTYVVLGLFFFICGVIYFLTMQEFSALSMASGQQMTFGRQQPAPNVTEHVVRGMFMLLTSIIMFTIPLLTMRLIAEEKSKGTFELLVTCPISDWSILLGKYFALVTVGFVIVLISGAYPLITWWMGRANQSAPEWPIVISCWIGLLLIFATYAAFGLMASSFTENQIAAAVITLIGLILWQIMGYFPLESMPQVRAVIQELSASQHTENFIKGVLMLKDFAFYLLSSFLFLFIASKTLDARRWRI